MSSVLKLQGLYSHVKMKTCWKSSDGSCIDLVLSNKKYSFKFFGAGKLVSKFLKREPKMYRYRCYKNFDLSAFLMSVGTTLVNELFILNLIEY